MFNVEDLRIDDMKDEIIGNLKNVLDVQEKLNRELSKTDLRISDIEHYMELADDLNVANGYDAYKLLRSELRHRRIVKDKINEISPLAKLVGQRVSPNNASVKNVCETVDTQVDRNENGVRNYRVREMTSEFGQVITTFDRTVKKSMEKTSRDIKVYK